MKVDKKLIAIVIFVGLIGFFIGKSVYEVEEVMDMKDHSDMVEENKQMDHGNTQDVDHSNEPDHKHIPVRYPDNLPVPEVKAFLHHDPTGGWNLELQIENFTLSPIISNKEYGPAEGHGHLYIDEKKINRLYSNWYHISDDLLPPGEHQIGITLSDGHHKEYARDKKFIGDQIKITVEE